MYKNYFFIIAFGFFALSNSAQTVFYSENFQGTNNWTLNTPMGTEGADPNFFTISANEGGVLPPGCGVANNGNNTLHVTSVFNPSGGASYDAGGLCGFLFCPQTDRRAESATINCSAYSSIILSFNFISLGQALIDNASVLYFDGTNWTTLVNSIKSTTCGNGQGQWTAYSVPLPSSANNNSNVKIGFRWVNNDDGVGTDPSFAVDEIKLTGTTASPNAPQPSFTVATTACSNDTLSLNGTATNGPTSWQWQSNPSGPVFTSPTSQNTSVLFSAGGTYTITLTATNGAGSGSATQVVIITTAPQATASNAGPYCTGDIINLFSSGGGTYTWSGPMSFSSTQQNPAISNALPIMSGPYSVTVTLNGCTSTATTSVTINACTSIGETNLSGFKIYPNPAKEEIILSGIKNTQVKEILLFNYSGQLQKTPAYNLISENEISLNVNSLENGVYLFQVMNHSGGKLHFPFIVQH